MEQSITSINYRDREYEEAFGLACGDDQSTIVQFLQISGNFGDEIAIHEQESSTIDRFVTVNGKKIPDYCWKINNGTLNVASAPICLGKITQRRPLTTTELQNLDTLATKEMSQNDVWNVSVGNVRKLYETRPHMAQLIRYMSHIFRIPEREFLSNLYEESRFYINAYNPETRTICREHPDYELTPAEEALPRKERAKISWRKTTQCRRDGEKEIWPIPYGSRGSVQFYWHPRDDNAYGDIWNARVNDPRFRKMWHEVYPDYDPPIPGSSAYADLLAFSVHFMHIGARTIELDPRPKNWGAHKGAVTRRWVHRRGPGGYNEVTACYAAKGSELFAQSVEEYCDFFRRHRRRLWSIDNGLAATQKWVASKCSHEKSCNEFLATHPWARWELDY